MSEIRLSFDLCFTNKFTCGAMMRSEPFWLLRIVKTEIH